MGILQLIVENFFHIQFIGYALSLLCCFFFATWVFSLFSTSNRSAFMLVKFAPSVLTAAGLMGTFVGLTMGFKRPQSQ